MKRKTALGLAGVAVAGGVVGAGGVALSQSVGFQTIMSSLTATRTVADSDVIPAPAPTFGGQDRQGRQQVDGLVAAEVAPKPGSPNVLLVLIDDEGFAANSRFGGLIPTPVSDQLASEGLRYTNFHTTALCSPTRAALITGRNHGAVGFEMISELATGFPGYNADDRQRERFRGAHPSGERLRDGVVRKGPQRAGITGDDAGPKYQWPTGQGFDYFYGFLGGDMDQWHPRSTKTRTRSSPTSDTPATTSTSTWPTRPSRGCIEDHDLKPQTAVFLYYAPGATHAPHQPTPDWIAKMKGKFDMGWDAYREYAFKRQQKLGIIPKGAKLTSGPTTRPTSTTACSCHTGTR